MGKVSQASVKHMGIPVNTRVETEVGQALIAESLRIRRTLAHTTAEILRYWYEDTYLPSQKKEGGGNG